MYRFSRRWLPIGLLLAMVAAAGCSSAPPAGSGTQPASGAKAAAPAPAPAPSPAPAQTTAPAKSTAPAAPAAPAPAKGPRRQVAFGTGAANSSWYPAYVAMGNLINKGQDLVNVTVVETGGAVTNLKRLQAGEFLMVQATHDAAADAQKGQGGFKDTPIPGLRLLWQWLRVTHTVFVRADSGVNTIYDLNGKPFAAGPTGSGTEQASKRIFEMLGIKPDYKPGTVTTLADMVKDRRLVGFIKSGAPDAAVLDVASTTPIRLLPIPEADLAKVQAQYPGQFVLSHVDPGTYKGQTEKIPTYAFWSGVYGTTSLTNDQAYGIVKAIYQTRAEVAKVLSDPTVMRDFAKPTIETAVTPLHAGAVKLFEELGLKVPDKLKG